MKKQFLILLNLIIISSALIAQTPNGFKYQTIIRNTDGTLVKNKTVSLKLSILSGNISGPTVYSETHAPATNDFGLVNIHIGGGTVQSGDFSKINWSSGSFFLKVEIDLAGGSIYTTVGTSQFLSVPYAKYAESAGKSMSDSNLSKTCIYSNSKTPPVGFTYSGEFFISQRTTEWETKTNLPVSVFRSIAATVNNKIYVIGGDNSTTNVKVNQEYDPVTNSWASKADLPNPRSQMTAEVVDNKVYVIGGIGSGSSPQGTVEVYDPLLNTWTTKTSMPTARVELSSAVFNNVIYVFGGYNSGNLTKVEAYNPATDTWSTKTSMPSARRGQTSIEFNNKIYVIGGYGSNYLSLNEEYDPVADQWTTKSSMFYQRVSCNIAVIENLIYVIGGTASGPSKSDKCEAYNPNTNTWITKAPMITARAGGACACWNNTMYVFGGNVSTTSALPTAANESYAPPKTFYLHCRN